MSASGLFPRWYLKRNTEEVASVSTNSKRPREAAMDDLDDELSSNTTSLPGAWQEEWQKEDELSRTVPSDGGFLKGVFNLIPTILTPNKTQPAPTSPDELSADIPQIQEIAAREIYRPRKIPRTSPERSVSARTDYNFQRNNESTKPIPHINPAISNANDTRRRKSPVRPREGSRSSPVTRWPGRRSQLGPYPSPSLSPERVIKEETPTPARNESAVEEITGLFDQTNLLDEIASPLAFEQTHRYRREADWTPTKPRSVFESKHTRPLQRRTKTVREEEAKREEEARRLAAARAHIRKLKRFEPSEEDILLPLSDDWEDRVDICLQTRNRMQKLAKTPDGSELTINDFTRVRPGQWLNDEIVNGYIRLIVDAHNARKGIVKGKTPKYHAFNTFFYANLISKGYQSVARWATKAKLGGKLLLEVDMIFIPINQSSHWTLLVITPPSRTIEYFDSFSGNPTMYARAARTWLAGELGPKYYKEEEWLETKPGEEISPLQTNGWDCGVFAITTARMVAEKWEPLSYSESDINQQRRRVIAELLNGALLPWGVSGELYGRETESEHEKDNQDEDEDDAW